eukprot:COSAG05_NODE_221_length_13654_cov_29.450103_12_plen_91_part_00
MFAESSLTAVDPEVVALAERAAEFGCKAANSGPVVVSIVFGPGIETSGEISSSGVLPLIAESTLCWSYHFWVQIATTSVLSQCLVPLTVP